MRETMTTVGGEPDGEKPKKNSSGERWVALVDQKLVAVGTTLDEVKEVFEALRKKGLYKDCDVIFYLLGGKTRQALMQISLTSLLDSPEPYRALEEVKPSLQAGQSERLIPPLTPGTLYDVYVKGKLIFGSVTEEKALDYLASLPAPVDFELVPKITIPKKRSIKQLPPGQKVTLSDLEE